jgi:lipopolysaccharide transport system ATP-binding protein
MSSDYAIQVKNVTKTYQIYDNPQDRLKQMFWRNKKFYREFKALDDVSFEVKKGETVGIIGRNGSGKSTLLQIICGTLAPTSGTVEVNGRVAALLELGAGFNPEFTGKENVYMNATILGLSKEEIDAKYDDIVAFADIGDFINQPVKSYSSGMYVRLAFAVIAHVDADILVIDEALAVGDVFFTQKCMRFLRKFMKTGAVLFVSHDTSAVVNLCPLAVWLQNGRTQLVADAKTVCEKYLENLYAEQQDVRPEAVLEKEESKLPSNNDKKSPERVDSRLKYINQSKYRNDIEIFEFDSDAEHFGDGSASIRGVYLVNEQSKPLSWVVGGDRVGLLVETEAHQVIQRPIVGFFVKDRLGQVLFGDNTYISYMDKPVQVKEGGTFTAKFSFTMPVLPQGNYTITVAIADGTQDEHTQCCWVHDACAFESHASSVTCGLAGVPMLEVEMEVQS